MKKFLLGVCSLLLAVCVGVLPVAAEDDLLTMAQKAGYPATADILPKASIVVDADSGQILWGENVDLKWDPASTTKTMVVYLTFEAISQGKISMDTEVVATETDQAIASIYALNNNKIVAGETYTVRELLTMTLVPSSNVTTLMLAHLIHDGDDASFLQLMNDTAQSLGMSNTRFYNGTGAVFGAFEGYYAPAGSDPSASNEVTAKDMAILAYHLIKKHPDVLEFTNDTQVTVKAGTPLEETFDTYNHSLPGAKLAFEGVDGLKTGSSPQAGYNSIVTAKRGDTRLIAVVLGASAWGDPEGEFVRNYFVNTLLDYGFTRYQRQVVAPAGTQDIDGKKWTTDQNFYAMVKDGVAPQLTVANDHLQVAGSIDPMSGVPAKAASSISSDQSSDLLLPGGTQNDSKSFLSSIPLMVYFLVPILLVLVLVAIFLGRGKNRRAKHTENGPYSRRHRRRK